MVRAVRKISAQGNKYLLCNRRVVDDTTQLKKNSYQSTNAQAVYDVISNRVVFHQTCSGLIYKCVPTCPVKLIRTVCPPPLEQPSTGDDVVLSASSSA